MNKDFNKFMSQLQETNQTLDFFCDFEKIAEKVDDIKLSLCMLNSMIGTTDLRRSVETIWKRDRTAFGVMDILIAVRSEGKKLVINSAGQCVGLEMDGAFLEMSKARREEIDSHEIREGYLKRLMNAKAILVPHTTLVQDVGDVEYGIPWLVD